MILRAILITEEPSQSAQLRDAIADRDVLIEIARPEDDFWQRVAHENYDLILVSPSLLPEPATDTIRSLRNLPDAPEVVLVRDDEDADERARFLASGCLAVLNTSLPKRKLRDALRALRKRRLAFHEKSLTESPLLADPQLRDFVSASPAMHTFMNVVHRIVPTDTSLLITGETVVGKERLARAIHAEGPRSPGPFVSVNCGALPEALLESELFGHEEGAFTGAVRSRRGWFELAHRGTIFLDEVGEMPLHLQVKLLHVLQSHEVQRVGAETPIHVDVRVMAATNRELTEEVTNGHFRRDLFFRLGVVNLAIPPLRERAEDIPDLVKSYLSYFRSQIPHEIEGISPEALDALVGYSWPGNVRELINIVERAMLLCDGHQIGLLDLPDTLRGSSTASAQPGWLAAIGSDADGLPDEWFERPLRPLRKAWVADLERAYLIGLLTRTGGRIGETARRAGIEPRSLYEKMRRYQLQKEDFRKEKKD